MGHSLWLYPLIFLVLPLQFAYPAHSHLCLYEQSLALLQLNHSFTNLRSSYCDSYVHDGRQPNTMPWKRGTDCCRWYGVACDDLTGNVITLELSCRQGVIHSNSSLFQLSHLQYLQLTNNDFSLSPIPNAIGNLKHLSFLFLYSSNFSGPFPSFIANLTELAILNLSFNALTGPLPSHVVGLHNLATLLLSGNSFNGTVPSWLFALPSLSYLDLQSNRFTGPIEEFPHNSVLATIDMSNNELYGPIPQSIFKLVNLSSLHLAGNNLTGIVELEMFLNLKQLQVLDLSYNSLSVSTTNTNTSATFPILYELRLSSCKMKEFPNLLRGIVGLQTLDLSNNQIHGHLPNWAGYSWRETFTYLNLSHNFIIGLGQLHWKGLGILDLRSNLLEGPLLPSSICNLRTLDILDLSRNSFVGSLPQCLGRSINLRVLDLRMNSFQGTIPITFAKGNILRNLDLHGNQLEGTLPRSLANCKYLEVLDLGNNQINDTFPHWLETLPNLQILVFKSNRFHGPISTNSKTEVLFSKLRIIDLSHNEFTGFLPSKYLRNFKAMTNVSENEKEGKYIGQQNGFQTYYSSITVATKGQQLEFVRILTIFTTIDLSNNKFEGEIPNFIGNLNSLRVLNLSHNSLVGHIPSTLGNLVVLESLDLSSNQLVGEIPLQLVALTFLEVLNLSQNHLVGRIPQGNQFNTFENVSYSGNSALCGFPLSKDCGDDQTLPLPPIFQQKEDQNFASGFTWKVVSMGYACGIVVGLVMGYLMFLTGKPKWFTRIVENEWPKNVKRHVKRGLRRGGRRNGK